MANKADPNPDGWIISSYSNGNGACVAVKFAEHGAILVRDSKDRRTPTPMIAIPSSGWAALLKNC